MPVLVLHGDSDVALGVELLDGIEAAMPDVTVKVLKNCSHWYVCPCVHCSIKEVGARCLNVRSHCALLPRGMCGHPYRVVEARGHWVCIVNCC